MLCHIRYEIQPNRYDMCGGIDSPEHKEQVRSLIYEPSAGLIYYILPSLHIY